MTHARLVKNTAPSFTLHAEFPLPPGITALAGPAAAGKSLTLALLAGFTRPGAGRILIEDAIVFDRDTRIDVPPQRRRCAHIPASAALFPHMTLRQNLMFAAARWARLERHKRVANMMDRFELNGAIQPPNRAAIARAILSEPKLLLIDDCGLDEPTLRLTASAFPGPILLVTRDLDLCYACDTGLILLEAGRILQRGRAAKSSKPPPPSMRRASSASPISFPPKSPRSIPAAAPAASPAPTSRSPAPTSPAISTATALPSPSAPKTCAFTRAYRTRPQLRAPRLEEISRRRKRSAPHLLPRHRCPHSSRSMAAAACKQNLAGGISTRRAPRVLARESYPSRYSRAVPCVPGDLDLPSKSIRHHLPAMLVLACVHRAVEGSRIVKRRSIWRMILPAPEKNANASNPGFWKASSSVNGNGWVPAIVIARPRGSAFSPNCNRLRVSFWMAPVR